MSDDARTIDHPDPRRELKELREAIDGLRRRLDLIELSQPTSMIYGVNTRTLDDRLRHIESVLDILDRPWSNSSQAMATASKSSSSHEGHPRGDMLGEAGAGTT
jgi:hypothetical protein